MSLLLIKTKYHEKSNSRPASRTLKRDAIIYSPYRLRGMIDFMRNAGKRGEIQPANTAYGREVPGDIQMPLNLLFRRRSILKLLRRLRCCVCGNCRTKCSFLLQSLLNCCISRTIYGARKIRLAAGSIDKLCWQGS